PRCRADADPRALAHRPGPDPDLGIPPGPVRDGRGLDRPRRPRRRPPRGRGAVPGLDGGSSAMPHKSNPTSAVLLHRNGMRVPGALSTLTTAAAEAVEERSDGAWHAEWPALSELMTLAISSLIILDEMIAGLTVDAEAMRANLDAAGPGLFSEKLAIVYGDRLSKDELAAIVADGTDPVAALREAVGDEDGIEDFFSPERYLGEAEDIRRN